MFKSIADVQLSGSSTTRDRHAVQFVVCGTAPQAADEKLVQDLKKIRKKANTDKIYIVAGSNGQPDGRWPAVAEQHRAILQPADVNLPFKDLDRFVTQ